MKKAMKYPQGIKTVISLLAYEEKTNQEFIAALNPQSPAATTAVTFVPPRHVPTPTPTSTSTPAHSYYCSC